MIAWTIRAFAVDDIADAPRRQKAQKTTFSDDRQHSDAAYGINTEFRDGLTELGLPYVVGVQGSMTVWEPGKQPLPAKPRGKMRRPPRLLQRTTDHQPFSVKQLAMRLPAIAFQEITWREGTDRKLRSRFAAVRVRAAHRDYEKAEPHVEEWLLIQWPRGEAETTKY